jgi:hypothetical protein
MRYRPHTSYLVNSSKVVQIKKLLATPETPETSETLKRLKHSSLLSTI